MHTNNLLKIQVIREMKRKKVIFFSLILLAFIYLSINLTFGDMGLLEYIEISKKKTYLERQLAEIQEGNKQLKTEIRLIKEDGFYKERYAREEYGLAKCGEIVVILNDKK